MAAKLEFGGLTALEVHELKQALTQAGGDQATALTVQPESAIDGARKGEPVTLLAILALSQITLTGLAIYLAKGRTKIKKRERIRWTDEQGRAFEYELDIEGKTETELKADLMKQLAALKIPVPDGISLPASDAGT